jgi:hypothetical protein
MAKQKKYPWLNALLMTLVTVSWTSGVLFFTFNRWVRIDSEFGTLNHPLQHIFLTIHGASAFLMMILYGFFIGTHVIPHWQRPKKVPFGPSLFFSIGGLIFSAYLLYYVGHTGVRTIVMAVHVSIGFLLPVIMGLHITAMIKRSKQLNQK